MGDSGTFKCGLWLWFMFIAFSVFSPAQEASTASFMNGRGWKSLGNCKVAYLMGFEEGMFGGLIKGRPEATYQEIKGLYLKVIAEKFSRAKIISEIDKFYEDSLNILIPVHSAVEWVTMKMNGASPERLQRFLANLHRMAYELK